MKNLLTIAMLSVAMLAVGAPKATTNKVNKVDAAQLAARRAEMRAKNYAKTGGAVEKQGVRRGKIAIIDTQDTASFESELMPPLKRTVELSRVNADVVYEKAKLGDFEAMLKDSKADFAIIVLSADGGIATQIAPEERWAAVNVKKYARGFKSIEERRDLYNSRCAKAVLKAFSLLCGGGASRYPNNLADTVKMEDLDTVKCLLPLDMIDRYRNYMNRAGIPQRVVSTYRKACMDGWAPAPTNDIQKAIWDEVHELPTKPIVIGPEKKGK